MRAAPFITAALLLMSSLSSAAQAQGRWQTLENKPQCEVWKVKANPVGYVTWTGPCVNGKAHGSGVMVWTFPMDEGAQVSSYESEMRNGKAHGQASMTWADGNRYMGGWRDNIFNDYGVHLRTNGDRFEGEWRDGFLNGYAVAAFSDGDRFEGEWKDDIPHGHGSFYDASMDLTFTGTWAYGCLQENDTHAVFWRTKEECGF